jgi:ATP-dependent protease ClpP protease subunit
MWHELMSLSLFRIDTPSSSEETSKILRKLQNIANSWLSTVSKMSKDEIDQMVKNKEFWMTGEEALQKGFVDHLIDK